ncbi:HMG box domain-containing protein [Mycena kentingensis (nom. inval.)]|nr:HMG box domain-containing protein [Mycena kentingensis (nom. inval.)]
MPKASSERQPRQRLDFRDADDDDFVPAARLPSASPPSPSAAQTNRDTNASSTSDIPRPRNAFIFFRSDFLRAQKAAAGAQHKALDQTNVSSLAGTTWQAMTAAQKEPYREQAAREKEMYAVVYPGYKYTPNAKRSGKSKSKGKGKVRVEIPIPLDGKDRHTVHRSSDGAISVHKDLSPFKTALSSPSGIDAPLPSLRLPPPSPTFPLPSTTFVAPWNIPPPRYASEAELASPSQSAVPTTAPPPSTPFSSEIWRDFAPIEMGGEPLGMLELGFGFGMGLDDFSADAGEGWDDALGLRPDMCLYH